MWKIVNNKGLQPSWWRKVGIRKGTMSRLFSSDTHQKRPLLNVQETNIFQPNDVKLAADNAIQKIQFIRKTLRDHVSGQRPLPSITRCLELLDAISNELCLAIDSAEFIRNAHQNPLFQQAAGDSFSLLNSLIADLNADTNLYNILNGLVDDKATFQSLSFSDQQVALDLLRDFKLEGIHLSDNHRHELQTMNHEVSDLESQWSQNILHSGTPHKAIDTTEEFDQFYVTAGPFPKVDRTNFQNLSAWLGRTIQQPADAAAAQVLVMPREQRTMGMVMASVENDHIREKLWWEYTLTPRENISTLPQLLYKRHTLANFLGYKHYAEKSLLKNVAKDTSSVRELISVLSDAARPYAKDVLDTFRARKQYLAKHGNSTTSAISAGIQNFFSSTSSSSVENITLNPWDIAYLQHQSIPSHLLARKSSSSMFANSVDPAEQDKAAKKIKDYFPISRCLEGLSLVTESLFGVKMLQDDVQSSEAWIQHRQPGDLVKFHLFDNDELLGTVYIDLFRRSHKFPGAAHFTVRCGCDAVTYGDDILSSEFSYHSNYHPNNWKNKKQTPVVALVFPFQAPTSHVNTQNGMTFSSGKGSSHTLQQDQAVLDKQCLSLGEVETLFHEWGHALHSLLSKSKYQHHSGTRGSTDFIEIPSHLFEFFARDPQVISQWARHYRTGETIPTALLDTALSGKNSHQGLDLQVQIALSLADQYLLSDETLLKRFNTSSAMNWSLAEQQSFFLEAMNGIAILQQEFTDLPVANLSLSEKNLSSSQQWLLSSLQSNASNATNWQMPYISMLAHRHFVGYAGSYHSYLYAKVVAAQIWSKLFADNALSRDMGQFLREQLLSWGSSKPAESMLFHLLNSNKSGSIPGKVAGEHYFQVDPEPYLRMMMKSA